MTELEPIIFSEEELRHLSKNETNKIRKLKRHAESMMKWEYNGFCPICGQKMIEEVLPLSRRNYCEVCGYYER